MIYTYNLVDPKVYPTESRGFRIAYTTPPYGSRELKLGMVVDVKTQPTTKSFEWCALFSMSNHADQGENVAVYGKGFKYGRGATWAGCFEAKDMTGKADGALYGLEVDVWANGVGRQNRFGIGFNFGTAKAGESPVIDYAIDCSPNGGSRTAASLGVALNVNLDCKQSVISVGNNAETPAIVDIRAAGPVGALLSMGSINPLLVREPLGPYIGKLRIMIDGNPYHIPVYG